MQQDREKLEQKAEVFAAQKQWSQMAIASAPLTQILALANGGEHCLDVARKINDSAYLDNATRLLKIAKALDQLNELTLSYKYCAKAFRVIDSLVKERKE